MAINFNKYRNINEENYYEFELLGELVTVESNNAGDELTVTFGGKILWEPGGRRLIGGVVIEDSKGHKFVDWPDMNGLPDDERLAKRHDVLRFAAEESIKLSLLHELPDLREMNDK